MVEVAAAIAARHIATAATNGQRTGMAGRSQRTYGRTAWTAATSLDPYLRTLTDRLHARTARLRKPTGELKLEFWLQNSFPVS